MQESEKAVRKPSGNKENGGTCRAIGVYFQVMVALNTFGEKISVMDLAGVLAPFDTCFRNLTQ